MEKLKIQKNLIAEALNKNVNEIENEDVKRLEQYITVNEAVDGKDYYWYCDCDNVEAVADMNGRIINIEDTNKFFNII